MPIRSVFVHVDDTRRCERRIELAAQIARASPAKLTGAYLVPNGSLTPFQSAMLPERLVEMRLAESGEAQSEAEARLRNVAARTGLMEVEWRAPAGDAVEAAVAHARFADLAVLGQAAPEDPHAAFLLRLAQAVLLSAGHPVLFVPYAFGQETFAENVLVAWKDTRESARAVADALPLLRRARRVHVVAVAATEEAADAESHSTARLREYLARHGVAAAIRPEIAADIDTGELLLSRAADLGVDLFVMGAYSRSPLDERLWGGVTRFMLASMTAPTLMSH